VHESGGLNYPSDVYVVDINGDRIRNLTHDKASDGPISWMPDGRRIIFQSQPSDPQRGTPHIYVIESDGTGRRRLTSAMGGMSPALSPDGHRILFLVDRPDRRGLYVMDADGSHKRRLTRGNERWGPSWSSDGGMILFTRGSDLRSEPHGLFVVNADGTGLTRLQQSRSLTRASWSPRGRTIALVHLNAAGTEWLTIADLRSRLGHPALRPVKKIPHVLDYRWGPDGRVIVYKNSAGVWIEGARNHAKRRRFAVQTLPRTWSPDQHWFVFSLRSPSIAVASVSGHVRRTVTRRICCNIDQIEWAPR
jgi:Tol biopolymer transport system component